MTERDERAINRLQWLLDAPLFVDDVLVDKLFDAVVRPEFEVQSREVGEISEKAHTTLFGVEAGGEYGLGLSFLTGKLKLSGKGKAEHERSGTRGTSTRVIETPVVSTGRRLEEIAAVYLSEHSDRLAFIEGEGTATTFAGSSLTLEQLEVSGGEPPRMLIFLEVSAETPIIPMACELETGRTVLLYEQYTKRAFSESGKAPVYPSDEESTLESRTAYWSALKDAFSSMIAMEIVERSGGEEGQVDKWQRLAWIDFRLPIGKDRTFHLHCVPDGKYHTGVFGYNFVRRGFRQGVRIVGTLKAGLDVNVLAIFDR